MASCQPTWFPTDLILPHKAQLIHKIKTSWQGALAGVLWPIDPVCSMMHTAIAASPIMLHWLLSRGSEGGINVQDLWIYSWQNSLLPTPGRRHYPPGYWWQLWFSIEMVLCWTLSNYKAFQERICLLALMRCRCPDTNSPKRFGKMHAPSLSDVSIKVHICLYRAYNAQRALHMCVNPCSC